MPLSGLKKQYHKANQFVSEKVAGVKGTELDGEFAELERRTDVLIKLIEEMVSKTQEYLQPNPVMRLKFASRRRVSKIQGQKQEILYPQPEGTLGGVMTAKASELGKDQYALSVADTGEAFKELAAVKYLLEDNIKSLFIEPLKKLEEKDLAEIAHHRKKLASRRLDYDYKKRKQLKGTTVSEGEIKLAEEKFEESKMLAESAMYNLMTNDAEHIQHMIGLVESCLEFHEASANILRRLATSLKERGTEAAQSPRAEHMPRPVPFRGRKSETDSVSSPPAAAPEPWARALYDFEAEQEGELEFKEGDSIVLVSRIDDNWLEGRAGCRIGYFPDNYVEIVVPL